LEQLIAHPGPPLVAAGSPRRFPSWAPSVGLGGAIVAVLSREFIVRSWWHFGMRWRLEWERCELRWGKGHLA